MAMSTADMIVTNAHVATLDERRPEATAVAIVTAGSLPSATSATCRRFGRARRERSMPAGDVDSRVERQPYPRDSRRAELPPGTPVGRRTLARRRARHARRAGATHAAPQWVRVVGGWSEFQFAERRMPTLAEINRAAPDTPVFVLHLYDRAWLNGAALRAVGYTKDTPDPPGGAIERDRSGNPTGLLIARPSAGILYARWRRVQS